MNSCPNICKLLNDMEAQGYISNQASSVMKDFLLRKFKIIKDIRTNDIDGICEEIQKCHGSEKMLCDEWLTGEFKEEAPKIIASIAVVEAFTKTDIKSHGTSLNLLILIHDRFMFTKAC